MQIRYLWPDPCPPIAEVFFTESASDSGNRIPGTGNVSYLSFLHLLESERPLLDVAGDLDELDSAEAADAEGGDDAEVSQLEALELLVNAAAKNGS